MCYLGDPFNHDLFVSYSHVRDAGGEPADLQKWSEAFAKALEDELCADPKMRELRIFLDKHHRPEQGVDPLQPLSEQLKAAIAASGLLVLLMSPYYLQSHWCQDERDWWIARQAELDLPPSGRIAVVRVWPTEEPWPPVLLDSNGHELPGFPFFEELAPGHPRPYGWLHRTRDGFAFESKFYQHLFGVVSHLYLALHTLKAQADALKRAREELSKLAQCGGQSIYLHGREDHYEDWEKAGLHLAASGFRRLPRQAGSGEGRSTRTAGHQRAAHRDDERLRCSPAARHERPSRIGHGPGRGRQARPPIGTRPLAPAAALRRARHRD